MARAGTPVRTLQEWMGHRDSKTRTDTEIYADYQPSDREAELVARAFGRAAEAEQCELELS
jgi:integrase